MKSYLLFATALAGLIVSPIEARAQREDQFAWGIAGGATIPSGIAADEHKTGVHAQGPRVVLVHGTPTLNTVYWTEDRPDEFCAKMAAIAGLKKGDAIAFGHTHLPWHREVEGMHFINTGSVGRPKDGDWRAGYVVLDVTETGINVDFVRVEYDVQLAAKAIKASSLPGEFAEQLLAGGKTESGVR